MAFYLPDADGFVSTHNTIGPWSPDAQHGGPPCALLAGSLQREVPPEFRLARITATFLRAVPLARVRVETQLIKAGRTTRRLRAILHTERPVLELEALFVRAGSGPDTTRPSDWPPPESAPSFEFPFFQTERGYHKAVDVRFPNTPWGRTPVQVWARPRLPLVAGREDTPEERVILLTDAQSGMGPPVDPMAYGFANPDLNIAFIRRPQGEWLGLDIRSVSGPEGIGLAHSRLRDLHGELGVAEQTLIVQAR